MQFEHLQHAKCGAFDKNFCSKFKSPIIARPPSPPPPFPVNNDRCIMPGILFQLPGIPGHSLAVQLDPIVPEVSGYGVISPALFHAHPASIIFKHTYSLSSISPQTISEIPW